MIKNVQPSQNDSNSIIVLCYSKTYYFIPLTGNGVSFLKHEVRWVFNYIKTQAAITPDPCDGDHGCIESASDGKAYWANIFVNETLPVVSKEPLQ